MYTSLKVRCARVTCNEGAEEGGGVMYWGVYRGGHWGRDLSGVRSRGLWLQRMGLAIPWSALKEQSMSVWKAASGASSSASAGGFA